MERHFKRAAAAAVSAALIIAAPGIGTWEAVAQVIRVPAAVANPGGGAVGAAAISNAGINSLSHATLQAPSGGRVGISLPTVSADGPALPNTNIAPLQVGDDALPGVRSVRISAAGISAESYGGLAPVRNRTRLSAIAKTSARLSAGVSKLSGANLKSGADFVSGRIDPAKEDAAAPAVSGAFGKVKNLLSRTRTARGRSLAEPETPKKKAGKAEEDAKDQALTYDIHEGWFKAGYLAASIYAAGTQLTLPAAGRKFGRANSKERKQFIRGLAYRVAEFKTSETAGKAFFSRAETASDAEIGALLAEAVQGADTAHPVLKENLQDADFTEGYLTGMAWRPGKQLMMPAPSLWDRFKPGLKKRMQARDERFVAGLFASLSGTTAAALKENLASGPAIGTRDFGTKLQYALNEVLTPLYDKSIEEGLPYLPGTIRIPRSLKGLILGHMVFIMFGIYMHVSAQPYLVYGLTGSKTMMGVIRNVHFGAYSASSFLPIGPAIDKTDFKTMFIWTSVSRAALMGLIPILFFSGYMTFAVLIGIVALNPMFQSLMTNSDTAARDSFLGRDEHVVREGSAFGTKVSAIGGLVIPAAAAWVVSQLVVAFGNPAGYAAAYAGYGLMLLLSIPIFMAMVRDPRYYDASVPTKPSKNPLNIFVPLWTVMKIPYIAGKWLIGKLRKKKAVIHGPEREAVLAAAKAREVPYEPGRRMKNFREKSARFFDKIEATQGVSVILRSDTLSLLVAITAIELFISDALMFVVIPNYIIDVIQPQASLASVPVIGSMLTTPVGIMGLMLTAGAIGRYLGSRWASGPKGAKRIKKWGHKWLYRGAAISGLTFWAMLIPTFFATPGAAMTLPVFWGSMAVLLAFEFFLSLLATPLGIAMSPVRRKQIPNDMVGKVSAAFTMVDVGLMAAGALLIGILIDIVPIQIAVAIIAVFITATSVLEWLAPKWLSKIKPEGWEDGKK